MKKENIIRLVKQFKEENYKELVGALIVFEILDNEMYYETELEELRDEDIRTLENIYEEWMNSDIAGLLSEDLKDIIDKEMESD